MPVTPKHLLSYDIALAEQTPALWKFFADFGAGKSEIQESIGIYRKYMHY